MDDRGEYTPGWKFNQWELKGVPLRIEIGPRDLKQEQVVMVRRDLGQKAFVKEIEVESAVEKLLEDIQSSMFAKAKNILEEKITTVQSYDEFKKVITEKGGFIKAAWCENADCEAKIKEETTATIRVRPFQKEKPISNCVCCGKEATEMAYFAKSY